MDKPTIVFLIVHLNFEQYEVWGTDPLQLKICTTFSQPSKYAVPPYGRFHIHDSTNSESCSAVVFTLGKKSIYKWTHTIQTRGVLDKI